MTRARLLSLRYDSFAYVATYLQRILLEWRIQHVFRSVFDDLEPLKRLFHFIGIVFVLLLLLILR